MPLTVPLSFTCLSWVACIWRETCCSLVVASFSVFDTSRSCCVSSLQGKHTISMRLHTYAYIRMLTYACLHTLAYIRMLTYACLHTYAYTRLLTYTCLHTHAYIRMHLNSTVISEKMRSEGMRRLSPINGKGIRLTLD